MPSFSHSRIGRFESCPLQYKFAYIDRIKVETEDTIETFLGSRAHEALEKLYKDKRFEKLMSLEELLEYYNKLWKENWKDTIIIVKEEYTQENYRKIGERCLTDYYNRHKPFDEGKIIGLETMDFLPLDDEGNYKFHIWIDRLMDMGDGLYEVHDYKTGSSLLKQEELDEDRQLAMYSLWVRRRFKDFKKARLVWHYLAFDKEVDSFRTKEQLEDLRKDVMEEIRKIEAAEEFPANVSGFCDWCLYKSICPEWGHGEELEEKPENEYLNDPGLKLVDEYVRIKGELDEQLRQRAAQRMKELARVEKPIGARIRLRSFGQSLSETEVGAMLKKYNFFSKQYNWNKNFCNPDRDFINEHESTVIKGDKVVLDHATGLMWHQSRSEKIMTYNKAKQWIDELNRRDYAGYTSWRLPTLEEGTSLLESKKMNGELYIDSKFSAKQGWIFTSDFFSDSSGRVWVVIFCDGYVVRGVVGNVMYVRPVRSGQK